MASNERTGDSRVFVLVLDALHVASSRTRVVRDYARQFIERHVGAADLVAVVSPGGLTSATQDFTTDKARLLAAVDQFAGSKLTSATVEIDQERHTLAVPLHGGRDPSDGERAIRVRSLTNVLEALAAHLDRVENRRKSLLLFSEGIDYDMMDIMGTVQRQSSDVMKTIDRATGALMRANVSLYAIDPRALSSAEGDLVENPLYRTTPSATQSSVEAEYSDSIRRLRDLADADWRLCRRRPQRYRAGIRTNYRGEQRVPTSSATRRRNRRSAASSVPSMFAWRVRVCVSSRARVISWPPGRLAHSRTDAASEMTLPATVPGRPRNSRIEAPVAEAPVRTAAACRPS